MNELVDSGVPARRGDHSSLPAAAAVSNSAAIPATAAKHFGAMLAARRRELGLSQGDIAERLRLNPRRIAALEAADLSALPALTFVRGYLRNYARSIGLDAEPLLANLRERIEPPRSDASGQAGERAGDSLASTSAASHGPAQRGPALRPVVIASVIGALIIFAILGVVASRKPSAPAAVVPASENISVVIPSDRSTGVEPSDRVAVPEPAKSTVAEVARAAAPAAKAADASAKAVPAATLRLRFGESAWVEVVQADGRVLLSQVNAAGTEQRFSGQPPIGLVIGNASTVAVEWRGRVVDLGPQTNFDNVARVTLD